MNKRDSRTLSQGEMMKQLLSIEDSLKGNYGVFLTRPRRSKKIIFSIVMCGIEKNDPRHEDVYYNITIGVENINTQEKRNNMFTKIWEAIPDYLKKGTNNDRQ